MFPAPGRPHGLPRPEGLFEAFLDGEDPSKLSPLPTAASPSPPASSRKRAFTEGRALSPLDLLHCTRVATGRPVSSASGLCRRGVRCLCPALPPCTARCSHGLWIDHVPMPATPFPASDSFRCPFHPAVPYRCGCPVARERMGRQRFSALSGSERADACCRPEGRPPAGTGSLAARRLLRFRSARSRAPRRGRIGIGRKASARPEGLASAASQRPRRVDAAPADDPEGYPPYRSVSPEGARSPVSAVRSEERSAAPARSPGGLAPVVRAHPRARVARRRRVHGRMARRRLPTPEGVVAGAPLASAPRRMAASNPPGGPPKESYREGVPPAIRRSSTARGSGLTSKLGDRPQARQTSLPPKTASAQSRRTGLPRPGGLEPTPKRRGRGGHRAAHHEGGAPSRRPKPSRRAGPIRRPSRHGRPAPKREALSLRRRRSVVEAPGRCQPPGRWSRTCRCHVKERFRRPVFLSVRTEIGRAHV